MTPSHDPLTRDALAIWQAGLRAVKGDILIRQNLRFESEHLIVNDSEEYSLRGIDRIVVLGAGKAAASMADGLEHLWQDFAAKRIELTGWVNVPAESVSSSNGSHIYRHVARPFGINEPTLQACLGAGEIMRLARESTPRDLIICLISGGASALMPFPVDGVTLQDKLEVTRLLSRSGANIEELNTVRAILSRIKGGGLARAGANASSIITLVVSDILGDPIHLIGGGPTVAEPAADPIYASELIKRFDVNGVLPATIYKVMEQTIARSQHRANANDLSRNRVFVLGNNATAVDAAGVEAVRLGYAYLMESSPRSEGDVKHVARRIAHQWKLSTLPGNPNCIISGGEPTVHVPSQSSAGIGGRNQHLALEVLSLLRQEEDSRLKGCINMSMVSGGTDGEDGPTRSAGAILNSFVFANMEAAKLDHQDYLHRFDSYHFFEQLGGLLVTGPTGTNVCDLRVALAR